MPMSDSLFTVLAWSALGLAGLGLARRLWRWLTLRVEAPDTTFGTRLAAALAAPLRSPAALPKALGSLVANVLLQTHILRRSPVRWAMHMAIFTGFLGLIIMHAMDGLISYRYFPGYEPVADPYQWLRNLFGALVLLGLGIALARRLSLPRLRLVTRPRDWALILAVAAIVGSGFCLEAAKMVSPAVFERMVETYLATDDPDEIAAIEAFWTASEGAALADPSAENFEAPGFEALVEQGREMNEMVCASCHAPTRSAFVSRPLSALPALASPDARRALSAGLYWTHVLLALAGLALLPWAKFLHVAATPLNLLVRSSEPQAPRRAPHAAPGRDPARAENARQLGLDACTRCGECSRVCSVGPSFTALCNPDILPSEKLFSLRRLVVGNEKGIARLAEGSFICTECHRCTEVCPARIDLQDLWLSSKRDLARRGQAEAHGHMDRRTAAQWAALFRDDPPPPRDSRRTVNLTGDRSAYWNCVQCTTCTSVCPVVAASRDPAADLDLTPQQIMNYMRMGLTDSALGARMVWNCVTCYKCSEACPQGIRVADVLYELRNIAAGRLAPARAKPGEREP